MSNTTECETRYFMYTYDNNINDWNGSHNKIVSKMKHLSLVSTDENIVRALNYYIESVGYINTADTIYI